jgi:hypothetical protein
LYRNNIRWNLLMYSLIGIFLHLCISPLFSFSDLPIIKRSSVTIKTHKKRFFFLYYNLKFFRHQMLQSTHFLFVKLKYFVQTSDFI